MIKHTFLKSYRKTIRSIFVILVVVILSTVSDIKSGVSQKNVFSFQLNGVKISIDENTGSILEIADCWTQQDDIS